MGGSAVTKTGNTGKGTDGMGGGEQRQGSIWGLWNYVFFQGKRALGPGVSNMCLLSYRH